MDVLPLEELCFEEFSFEDEALPEAFADEFEPEISDAALLMPAAVSSRSAAAAFSEEMD